MASLIFAHAKQIVNKCEKLASKAADVEETLGRENWKQAYTRIYNQYLQSEFRHFDKYLHVAAELHERYGAVCGKTKQAYFVSVRPTDLIDWHEFFTKIENFVRRDSFLKVKWTYEQKGETPSELGKGFHCHILIYESKFRSKGELLRATLSSFNKWIEKQWLAPNCIDVQTTKNPDDILNKYLIAYESDDDHKNKTKAMDELWRSEKGLPNILEWSASPSAIGLPSGPDCGTSA